MPKKVHTTIYYIEISLAVLTVLVLRGSAFGAYADVVRFVVAGMLACTAVYGLITRTPSNRLPRMLKVVNGIAAVILIVYVCVLIGTGALFRGVHS